MKDVPQEVKGWNWGAFGLSWIWGLGNDTYIALLALVPIIGFFMIFILGAKGSEWAWQNGNWKSVEDFKNRQRKWRNAFLIVLAIIVSIIVLGAMLDIFVGSNNNPAAYQPIQSAAQPSLVPCQNSIRVENGLNFPSPRREKNLLNDEQIEECQDSLELKPVRA